MANKYKYVCTVFTLFGTAPACVRGPAQRIFCMPGTRYRSPGPHPPAGGNRGRGHGHGRGGALANQGGTAACLLCRGRKGYACGRDGLLANRDGPAASRSGVTRARVCRIKRVSVCPAAGEGSRMPIRVSAGPKAGERMNAGPPSACLREMRGPVTRTASSVCRKGALAAGTGALPCLPAKMKGAPKGSLPHQKLTLKNYPLFGRPP